MPDAPVVPPEIEAYLDTVTPPVRRRDARTLLAMMLRVTGQTPVFDRGMIGFGQYHYRYPSGHEGDTAPVGFAPRKAAMSIYFVDGLGRHEAALARLGPHTHGVGCLYVKDLSKLDLEVLEGMVDSAYRALTAATYTVRARDAKPD